MLTLIQLCAGFGVFALLFAPKKYCREITLCVGILSIVLLLIVRDSKYLY